MLHVIHLRFFFVNQQSFSFDFIKYQCNCALLPNSLQKLLLHRHQQYNHDERVNCGSRADTSAFGHMDRYSQINVNSLAVFIIEDECCDFY